MTVFLDASAIVKRYADEDGSDAVRAMDAGVVSSISRVEVASALWRKNRDGGLDTASAAVLIGQFEADWYGTDISEPLFAVIGAVDSVLGEAATLVRRHPLRAYDAVQLSSALAARRAADVEIFVTFNRRLAEISIREGFTVPLGR